ncbi:unnamed protein product, partial [Mesorhabditis belari]|uniref:Uncharacterized protein n=1 Tax=Mesorhabditis belari TaxID=2138241 RepID=A0AAF3FG11_9BILA
MSNCGSQEKIVITFDTDPQYYLKSLTYAGIIGLFVNSFGAYVILFRSPAHFKTYRWHLLNYQICSMGCDAVMTLCAAPVFFLPIPVCMPMGLFNAMGMNPGLQMIIYSTFIHLIFAATMQMFFYKWQMIVPTGSMLKFSRRVKAIILSFTYFIFLTPHFIFLPATFENQAAKKVQLLADHPVYQEVWAGNVSKIDEKVIIFYMNGDNSLAKYIIAETVLGSILGFTMSWFWMHTVYIFRQKGKYSNATKQLQYKKYLVNLSSQMTVPMMTMMYPGSLLGLVIIFQVWNVQEIVQIAIFLFSCHGIVGTISILLMNEHYRNYLSERFFNTVSGEERTQAISLNAVLQSSKKNSTRPSTAQPAIIMG